MSSLRETVAPVIGTCQDALVDVGALLARTPEQEIDGVVAGMDLRFREVFNRLDATRRLLTLYRNPRSAPYDPAETLRKAAAQVATVETHPDAIRVARRCDGDAEQVVECVRVLTGSMALLPGGSVRTTVLPGEDVPQVLVEGSHLPDSLSLEACYTLSWEEWAHCWSTATGGGEVRREPGQVQLFLEGANNGVTGIPGLEAPLERLRRLVQRLRSWRGAIGHYEPGYADHAEIVRMYRDTVDEALRDLDGLAAQI